ncbi:methionyl-tRNA formyltransferase [Sphingomicrobium marinum]|uniref:methionyl-tRNA formyltransferase n=1 Tax=Sphingomicrobium marinum TaxID=1227950 RepID=UPI00223EA657|nr:methionyl-tRNA formyltransferase [Sphingomicrobium marinum]
MRVIMMGSPEFAVPTLDALVEAGHEVIAAYSQPPRPAGRGKKLQPTPIEKRARELGIEVRTPKSLKDTTAQQDFAALDADVAVVAAYGLILPQAILDAPRLGCINVHASLLPRWRGAAPVHRAIMAGDKETGVTIMQMEAGLDTGPMLLEGSTPIGDKNTGELTEELADMGGRLIVEYLSDPEAHTPREQAESGVTYAHKIDKEEARIDWYRDARELQRHIQGLAPWPGAWTTAKGERLKILAAECCKNKGAGQAGEVLDDQLTVGCGIDALRITRVQRAGKAACSTEDLLRGFAIEPGTILS